MNKIIISLEDLKNKGSGTNSKVQRLILKSVRECRD